MSDVDRPLRQAHRLQWLFPAWMRATRGEEAVGVVLDLLPPQSSRLSLRASLDLVRAGIHARRRGTPPLGVLVAYAFAEPSRHGAFVPETWHPWMLVALSRRTAAFRAGLVRMVPVIAVGGVLSTFQGTFGTNRWLIPGVVAPLGAIAFAWRRGPAWRAALLAANGYRSDLSPVPPEEVGERVLPSRWPNLRVSTTVAAISAMCIAIGSWTALPASTPHVLRLDPSGPLNLGMVLAVSCLVAVRVWVNVRSLGRVHGVSGLPPVAASGDVRWELVVTVLAWIAGLGLFTLLADAARVRSTQLALWSVFAVGSATIASAAALAERRVGRRVGLWEISPSLGPRPYKVTVDPSPPDPSVA